MINQKKAEKCPVFQLEQKRSLLAGYSFLRGLDTMTTLGSRVKMARGKESQEKFAARLEISKGALGFFYERGENLPKSDVILRADYL